MYSTTDDTSSYQDSFSDTIHTIESPHDSSSGIASDGPIYPPSRPASTQPRIQAVYSDDMVPDYPFTNRSYTPQPPSHPYFDQYTRFSPSPRVASVPPMFQYKQQSPGNNHVNGYSSPVDKSFVNWNEYNRDTEHAFRRTTEYIHRDMDYIQTDLQETDKLLFGAKKKRTPKYSHFDLLPDDIIVKIFSNLPTNQICQCACVSHRFYNLAWEPSLWTTVQINNEDINIDRALKTLTRRLSYDTPGACVMVEKVNLNGCKNLTDKGLHTLAKKCPELRHLELQGCCNITNAAVFEVASKCVNLEHLNLTGCTCITCISLTPEASMQSSSLHGKQIFLRYLDMTDCHALEDAGLQIITSYCSQLVYLYLRRCVRISDQGIQYVANNCPNLKEFSISDCRKITDFGLRELSRLESNLRYLSVAKCDKVSDVGVKFIAKYCYKIRYLNVRGCEAVSDESLELLAQNCTRLKSLDVGKCDVTDDGLQFLADHCPQIKKLSLKSCDAITNNGIMVIAQKCRALQQLNIQDCHVTVEAYRAVKKFCKRCLIEHTNPGFY